MNMKYSIKKTIGLAKWQQVLVKGFLIVSIGFLFGGGWCCAQNANDTVCFTYDSIKKELTIEVPMTIDGNSICFKIDTANEFLRTLMRSTDQTQYVMLPESTNPLYWGISGKLEYAPASSWFDSSSCMSVEFYYYNFNSDLFKVGARCPSKVNVVPKEVVKLEQEDVPSQTAAFPWGMFVAGVLLVCLVLVGFLLFRKKVFHAKRKVSKQGDTAPQDASLEIVEEVSSELVRNLDFVRRSPDNYYEMDMQQVFADTAVHRIYIHHTAIKKMYDFFKQPLESSEQTNETGCYFVGCWEYDGETRQVYNISVEDIVEPGDDLVPGEFSFNFGLKIGVKLFARLSELSKTTNRDFVHTVWMHSHPGLGLFLSSHDLLVQKQLTYSDAPGRLAAFVIDTNTPEWEMAVFTAKTDGMMNNKEDMKAGLFSLEQMYKWSRDTRAKHDDGHGVMTEVADASCSMENYYHYPWQANHQGTKRTFNAYFGGHAINAIENILYYSAGKQTVGGYLLGTKEAKGNFTNLVIDDCVTEWRDGAIAMLIVDAKVKDGDIMRYVGYKPIDCVMVFRSDNEMLVLTRANGQEPFPQLAEAAVCSMKLLLDWTRRKRIRK